MTRGHFRDTFVFFLFAQDLTDEPSMWKILACPWREGECLINFTETVSAQRCSVKVSMALTKLEILKAGLGFVFFPRTTGIGLACSAFVLLSTNHALDNFPLLPVGEAGSLVPDWLVCAAHRQLARPLDLKTISFFFFDCRPICRGGHVFAFTSTTDPMTNLAHGCFYCDPRHQ